MPVTDDKWGLASLEDTELLLTKKASHPALFPHPPQIRAHDVISCDGYRKQPCQEGWKLQPKEDPDVSVRSPSKARVAHATYKGGDGHTVLGSLDHWVT